MGIYKSEKGKEAILSLYEKQLKRIKEKYEDRYEELMIVRRECLQEHQRVEFGKGVLEKLIYAFYDSSYIYQENYVDIKTVR